MSPTDEALERRVARALGARAALKTVEPAALGERLARVHAAAGDAAGQAATSAPAPVVELPGAGDDDATPARWRTRLLVAAVASAAAAALVVAVALGAAHRDGYAPAPAATAQPSPSPSSYPGGGVVCVPRAGARAVAVGPGGRRAARGRRGGGVHL